MDAAGEPVVQTSVLYWGIAICIAIITGLFKAVGMRGRLNQEWGQRVGLLEAGLDELAAQELRRLRSKIDELLGPAGQEFDPLRVVVNPGELLKPVRQFDHLLAVRRGTRPMLTRLLRLGTVLTVAGLVLLPCIVVGAVHFSHLTNVERYMPLAWLGLALSLGAGVMAFFLLWYLQDYLARAEILSQTQVSYD